MGPKSSPREWLKSGVYGPSPRSLASDRSWKEGPLAARFVGKRRHSGKFFDFRVKDVPWASAVSKHIYLGPVATRVIEAGGMNKDQPV